MIAILISIEKKCIANFDVNENETDVDKLLKIFEENVPTNVEIVGGIENEKE